MKKTKQFKIFLIAAFAAVSSGTFAQVKIGTSPTVIDANSNLEVEATNNKKVIVHKSDGTVVIENTPSGAITDSIITVDATGNIRAISSQKLINSVGKVPYISIKGTFSSSTVNSGVVVTGLPANLNSGSFTYTPANGQLNHYGLEVHRLKERMKFFIQG